MLWKVHVIGNNIKKMISKIFSHNWFKILYYNFKYLPFHQAIHLPIDVSWKTVMKNEGKIIVSGQVKRGMISIGFHSSDLFGTRPTIIENRGLLHFKGGHIRIGSGSSVKITKIGKVEIDENVCLGANTIIISEESINLGSGATFSWNCQIMDTDTHSIINLVNSEISQRKLPVVIGPDTWIGNHVIINKGCILPQGTIVASMSLCNKNYAEVMSEYSLIGGVPAKLLKENVKRGDDKL